MTRRWCLIPIFRKPHFMRHEVVYSVTIALFIENVVSNSETRYFPRHSTNLTRNLPQKKASCRVGSSSGSSSGGFMYRADVTNLADSPMVEPPE
jgi:hypothetical protein